MSEFERNFTEQEQKERAERIAKKKEVIDVLATECQRFLETLVDLSKELNEQPYIHGFMYYQSPTRAAVVRAGADLKRCITRQVKKLYEKD